MQSFRFHLPTDLRFGEGILNDDTLYALPYRKVLIVTTKSISSARYGALETIQAKLEGKGVESVLFDQVTRPLTSKTILDAAALAREIEADAIIAHGGGKVIDAAKVIGRMVREKDEFLAGWLSSKLAPPFEHDPLDIIAVPTTLTVVASLNHKVYIYDASKDRYERLKHTSFTPKAAWVDPTLLSSLPAEMIRNSVSDVLVRAFELMRLEVSPLHTDMAEAAFTRITANVEDAIDKKSPAAQSALAYAHVLVGSLYVKKPYFPLHMLNDSVQGFHPEIHYGRFLFFSAPQYLNAQTDAHGESMRSKLHTMLSSAGGEGETLAEMVNALFESMNKEGDTMKNDRLDTKYPEDYLVHLKVLFPKFSSLRDQTIYRLIEDTML